MSLHRISSFFSCLGIFLLFSANSCSSKGQNNERINGLSFVASPVPIDESVWQPIEKTGANFLAIMPFAFQKSLTSQELFYDNPRQWWGERSEGCAESIRMAHENGFKVMLKPQIWIGGGDFTGYIDMASEDEWLIYEKNYSDFILKFAEIAEKEHVAILCIGTELGTFVEQRPNYWVSLIEEIKKRYKGKLTYAENWDCFDKPIFLPELDFIGVDAYFPLSEGKHPSRDELKKGWLPHLEKLAVCSKKHNRPILFTECGYRSIDFAGEKPWDFNNANKNVNEKLQADLLSVMFESTWYQPWMAGGFIWKWFPDHDRSGGPEDSQFTPQNKQAEKVIASFFQKK